MFRAFLFALLTAFCATALAADPHPVVSYSKKAAFEHVRDDLRSAAQPDRVHVAYRRPWRPDGSPASKAALKEVEALLDSIARETLGLK